MSVQRLFPVFLLALGVMALGSLAYAQAGPPGGMIYADDQLFLTIGTPTDLPPHGKFDVIYAMGDGLINVAEAAPGQQNYNGGRWEVRPVTFLTIPPTQFTNSQQVHDAAAMGQISIGPVVKRFECPLIPAN